MLGLDQEITKKDRFLKNNGLEELAYLLHSGVYESIHGIIRQPLADVHTDYSFLKDRILESISYLPKELPEKLLYRVLEVAHSQTLARIHYLESHFSGVRHGMYSDPIKVDGTYLDMYDSLYLGDSIHEEVASIHSLIIDHMDPSRTSEIFSSLDQKLELIEGEALSFFPTYKALFKDTIIEIHLEYLYDIKSGIELYLPRKSKPKPSTQFQHLKEVFKNPDEYESLLEVLRDVDPPVLSDSFRYIGSSRKKVALVAFLDVLKQRDKLKDHTSKSIIPLLESALDVSISERTFRNKSHVYYDFLVQIERLVR